MNTSKAAVARRGMVVGVTVAVIGFLAAAPGLAASSSGSGVNVVNTETVQVYMSSTGAVQSKRVYEQLALSGHGNVDLSNPVSTDGLRNLDGFGGLDVQGHDQIVKTSVNGTKDYRSVSNFDGNLPVSISPAYYLNGKRVNPADVVGSNGKLQVEFTVKNLTTRQQQVSFPDGHGGTKTAMAEVPVPMVGSLSTDLPSNFTNVEPGGANTAGDGAGGTTMTYTMTLFPPIGSTTATFGYSADITNGVVPDVNVSLLPVDPMASPTFKSAGDSYQGGASTGSELVAGAGQIDTNLLKLRDGAAKLLAGLIKLRGGADQLHSGLAGTAVPGANALASGAGQLDSGLGKLDSGASKLSSGARQLSDGTEALSGGAAQLASGAGKVSGGAGKLAGGAQQVADGAGSLAGGADAALAGSTSLRDGLKLISGGLGQLAQQMPAAADGIQQLQTGVQELVAGMGTKSDPATIIGGLAALQTGLTQLQGGAAQLQGGLDQLAGPQGLQAAKGGVDSMKTQLDTTLAQNGSMDQMIQGLTYLANVNVACVADPQCQGTASQLLTGAQQAKSDLTALDGGLGAVSNGLGDALTGLNTQLIPGASAMQAGLGSALTGVGSLQTGADQVLGGLQQLDTGLTTLADGVAAAIGGVNQLNGGAQGAYSGSQDLTTGLGTLDAGANTLASGAHQVSKGAGDLAAGAGKVAGGANDLAAGARKANSGAGQVADGASQLAGGMAKAKNGSSQVAGGAKQLADGLGAAADGSGQIADGLGQAVVGAPQLVDGAQRLSTEGMGQLIKAGESTAQSYGKMYAVLAAGAEDAHAHSMAYGAPKGAQGLTAYSFVIQGDNGESGRNWTRGVAALGLLGLGGGAFVLRRRLGFI